MNEAIMTRENKSKENANVLSMTRLTNVPTSLLNADQTGAGKTTMFGGTLRGTFSSQCLFAAIRNSSEFKAFAEEIAIRTRAMPLLVLEKIKANQELSQELELAILTVLSQFGQKDQKEETGKTSAPAKEAEGAEGEQTAEEKTEEKSGKKAGKGGKKEKAPDPDELLQTKQIILYSRSELDAIAETMLELMQGKTPEEVTKIKQTEFNAALAAKPKKRTFDQSLKGRFVTADGLDNVDSALSISVSITVHEMVPENDFYIAVDDYMRSQGKSVGGIIGGRDQSSGMYYTHMDLDMNAFVENLAGKRLAEMDPEEVENIKAVVKARLPKLLEAVAYALPTGHGHVYDQYTEPSFLMVEVRKQNLNPINAFATAVSSRDIVNEAVRTFAEYIDRMDSKCGTSRVLARYVWSMNDVCPENCTQVNCLEDFFKVVAEDTNLFA